MKYLYEIQNHSLYHKASSVFVGYKKQAVSYLENEIKIWLVLVLKDGQFDIILVVLRNWVSFLHEKEIYDDD